MSIAETLSEILRDYRAAYNEPFGAERPMYRAFARLAADIAVLPPVQSAKTLIVKFSVGQGRWAAIPWIAILDTKVTNKVSEGIYVIVLFRADMTGLYLTLNQGTTGHVNVYGTPLRVGLAQRTEKYQKRCASFENERFSVGGRIDLRNKAAKKPGLAANYELATIGFTFYDASTLPSDEQFTDDLHHVLGAYRRLVT